MERLRIHLTISAPPDTDLNLRSSDGTMFVEGLNGDIEIDGSDGKLNGGGRSLLLQTLDGDIYIVPFTGAHSGSDEGNTREF